MIKYINGFLKIATITAAAIIFTPFPTPATAQTEYDATCSDTTQVIHEGGTIIDTQLTHFIFNVTRQLTGFQRCILTYNAFVIATPGDLISVRYQSTRFPNPFPSDQECSEAGVPQLFLVPEAARNAPLKPITLNAITIANVFFNPSHPPSNAFQIRPCIDISDFNGNEDVQLLLRGRCILIECTRNFRTINDPTGHLILQIR